MFFYCYDLEEFAPDIVYAYGRILKAADKQHLENIGMIESKITKLTISNVISPLLAFCNENDTVDNLLEDVKNHYADSYGHSVQTLKNIFYDDLDSFVQCVRFFTKKIENIDKFYSKYCKKIIREFSSPLECCIVSNHIRCPCILYLNTNKTFVCMDNIVEVLKCDIPKLNYASVSINYINQCICSYLVYTGGSYYAGTTAQSDNFAYGEVTNVDYAKNTNALLDKLNVILVENDIDCVIYYNLHGQILKRLNKYIRCDMFTYAMGNIKCRDYSVQELCEYFKLEVRNLDNPLELTKTLYDLFIISDALILAKELSEISGFTINKVLNNNRAEIIEYALFHELYEKQYLLPPITTNDAVEYAGGLVLTPAQDYYENLVLLLDFNSLYPSIILEYNVCFSNKNFDSSTRGILPKILANMIQRRKAVKKLIKESKDNKIYNIRQKALKILANSIYGSLGYPKSRFCNYKMAAYITKKAREILVDTKQTIEERLNYRVIYGDTDSIMINTGLEYISDNIKLAKQMADNIQRIINDKYMYIEIELEKIYIKLLLYTKKKYAGVYLDSEQSLRTEHKGTDIVRKNICNVVIDIIQKIYDILLHVSPSDTKNYVEEKNKLFEVLVSEYNKLEKRDKKDFTINNVLSKPVEKFAKNVSLPHVHMLQRLQKKGIVYSTGDVVSYYIGKTAENEPVFKRGCLLTEDVPVDYDYYITSQILPALTRALSLTRYNNNEAIYKIFNKQATKVTCNKTVKFQTECCKNIQEPNAVCEQCNQPLQETFYLAKVQEILRSEISNLYKTQFVCKECCASFGAIHINCNMCGCEMSYKPPNEAFDNLLSSLLQKFEPLQYNNVILYIKMHINKSKYRIFDLSAYFGK